MHPPAPATDTARLANASPVTPFVGRSAELDQLREHLAAAMAGTGQLVTVAGEAGIGKTSLLERLTNHAAAAGATVARASCWQGPDQRSFWPWVQVLRALDPAATRPLLEASGASRARRFDDVAAELRTRAASRPLVLVIDDLHWADAASVRLLAHVAASLRDRRILLLGAYRDSEVAPDSSVAELLAEHVASAHLTLGGLSEPEVAALAAQVAHLPAGDVAAMHHRTGGNPLFVRELLRWLRAEGHLEQGRATTAVPDSVRAVLARRLEQLPARAHWLLGIAAVIGEEFDVPLLAAAADIHADEAAELIGDAMAARIVSDAHHGQACFAHPLLRDVRYEALSPSESAGLHRSVARALERRGAADPEPQRAAVARHLLRGGPSVAAEAIAAAVEAADWALAVCDHEGAVALLAEAIAAAAGIDASPADKAELELRHGDALVRLGNLPSAREAHLRAARLARRTGAATLLARAALGYGAGLAGFEIRLWDRSQIDLLEEALAVLPAEPSALRASLTARLAVALSLTERQAEREPLTRQAVAIAREAGDPEALAYVLSSYADVIAGPDHVTERLDVATEIVDLARRSGAVPLELLGRRIRIVALLELGRVVEVDAEIAAYTLLADRLRQPLYGWYVPLWLGMRALLDGRLADCDRLAADAATIGEQARSDNADMLTKTLLFSLWEVRGEVGDRLAEAGDLIGVPQEARLNPSVRAVAALLACHLGHRARAQAELARFTASGFADLSRDAEFLSNLTALTRVAVTLADARAAAGIASLLEPYADLLVVDGIGAACEGSVHELLGVLAAVQSRWDEAVDHLQQALDVHVGLGAVPLTLRTQVELAETLQARAEPGDADRVAGLLASATATARELGVPGPNADGGHPASSAGAADERAFCRDGDVWRLRYEGVTATLKDSKGLRDLARLLTTPGEPVHVSELIAGSPSPRQRSAAPEDGLTSTTGPVGDPVLDRAARDAYRRRIEDLREEIADAERCNDPARETRAREELDLLTAELGRAFGLGGRPRTLGDPVERARKAVAARIREAITRIGQAHPDLGVHLDRSVRTGTVCVYQPERPLRWRT